MDNDLCLRPVGAAVSAAAMIALCAFQGSAAAMRVGEPRDRIHTVDAHVVGVVAQVLGRVKATVLQADQQAKTVVSLLEKIEREYL